MGCTVNLEFITWLFPNISEIAGKIISNILSFLEKKKSFLCVWIFRTSAASTVWAFLHKKNINLRESLVSHPRKKFRAARGWKKYLQSGFTRQKSKLWQNLLSNKQKWLLLSTRWGRTDALYWRCRCSKSWLALIMTLMPSYTWWWNKHSSRQREECHLVRENCNRKKTQLKTPDFHAWPICAFWRWLELLRMLGHFERVREAVAWRRPQNIFSSSWRLAVFGYACIFLRHS